jgi:phage terminase small subunit
LSLTPKQEKAIQEYLTNGGNKTQAYKSAYNTSKMKEETINKKASELFKKGNIRGRLEELQKQTEKENEITREWVLNKAKEMIERSLEPEAIFTKKGDFTGEFRYDSAGAGKGMEIINKMLGYYAPTKEETVLTETQTLPDWFNRK